MRNDNDEWVFNWKFVCADIDVLCGFFFFVLNAFK